MKVLLIHGPNLNLLGTREPSVYGTTTLGELNDTVRAEAERLGMDLDVHQSAREGEIIELLHDAIEEVSGALVNPGAYSHTSRAIADAIRAVPYPVIEVHISNIHAREPWRARSVTAAAAAGVITGLGVHSYIAGLHALTGIVSDPTGEERR
ncbi:MAG: type II 3-dehydroquinate dehydratase [Actinobacteria bacterium]|nr:type II 3-dehydroquinate dehydratase [Actinomycetota bacterium]